MKRFIFTSFILFVFLTLSACGENSEKANTMMKADLTERENAILSTSSSNAFVFDYNVDSDVKKASVWIEKYEFGKLVEEHIGHITSDIQDEGSIIIITNQPKTDEIQMDFNTGSLTL